MRNNEKVNLKTILITLTIGALFFTFVYFLSRQNTSQVAEVSPTLVNGRVTETPTTTRTPTTGVVPENWKVYINQNPAYSINYPPEIVSNNPQRAEVRFFMLGETQTEGTEIFDGISLSINTDSYSEASFKEFVDEEFEKQKTEPTTREISELSETTIADKSGFTFNVVSLGDYTHIYLPMNNKSYMHIYYIAPDPENKDYQETVDNMLSSLKFNQ